MSREIFLAAARVHAGRAWSAFLMRFWCIHYSGRAAQDSGAEQEADLALAWLELAPSREQEQGDEEFYEANAVGGQKNLAEENKILRAQLHEAKELARHAIECVEELSYKGDGLVAGLKYRLEEIK